MTLPFIVDGHWDDRSSQPRPHSFAGVTAVPAPPRYVANAPRFELRGPLAPANSSDVLVFVAYPPSGAKDEALGTKVRLMGVETC